MSDKYEKITPNFFWAGGTPGKSVPEENPINAIDTSLRWQNAWMTAIALAWASETDKEELLLHPRKFLKEKCNWEVPEALDLRVTDVPLKDPKGHPTGWHPEEPGDGSSKKMGWYLAKTKVVMYLPPAPDVKQQAVALAAYLGTGRTYPFTTC